MVRALSGLPPASESGSRQKNISGTPHLLLVTPVRWAARTSKQASSHQKIAFYVSDKR
jgi:hypothetical protein